MDQKSKVFLIFLLVIQLCQCGWLKCISAKNLKGNEVIIGVLEHHHLQWPGWGPSSFPEKEKGDMFLARALFKKTKDGWAAFPHEPGNRSGLKNYPAQVDWNIIYREKSFGELKAIRPEQWMGPGLKHGCYDLGDRNDFPRIGEKSRQFAGWLEQPCYRPLLLINKLTYHDADIWEKATLPDELKSSCISSFRESIGEIPLCDNEHGETPTIEYPNNAIQLKDVLKSKNNRYLISMEIDPEIDQCGLSAMLGKQWFFLSDKANYLDVNFPEQIQIPGLHLVEIGDFDGDGKSEMLFWFDGYNRNGYVLFYNDCTEKVTFIWGYH